MLYCEKTTVEKFGPWQTVERILPRRLAPKAP